MMIPPDWMRPTACPEPRLRDFLVERLRDDLAQVWSRDDNMTERERQHRPGVATQVAIIDEMLMLVQRGQLPPRPELRILFFGYADHEDFDRSWLEFVQG